MPYQGHSNQNLGHEVFSQNGEDLMLLNIFNLLGMTKQRYLDLGAHHPTTISNTKLLYDNLWNGVNVEANPALIEEFKKERPRDITVNSGVAPSSGFAEFFMFGETSGLNTFSAKEAQRVESELKIPIQKKVVLPIRSINSLVAEYFMGHWPALLLSDLEGLDFEVLESADFGDEGPTVVVVETRRWQTNDMVRMMNKKGYGVFVRMGENLFFVQRGRIGELF